MHFLDDIIMLFFLSIINASKVLLEPNIEADEQVPTAHLLDFEFRSSGSAISPCYGYDCPRVPAYNCFERQFDC